MLTKVKSFFMAAAFLLVPAAFIAAWLLYPESKPLFNFGVFTSIALAALLMIGAIGFAAEQSKITNALRKDKPTLLARMALAVERRKAVHFAGRGFILGMLACFLIALLVGAGLLTLAALFALSYISAISMSASVEQFYNDEMSKLNAGKVSSNPLAKSDPSEECTLANFKEHMQGTHS